MPSTSKRHAYLPPTERSSSVHLVSVVRDCCVPDADVFGDVLESDIDRPLNAAPFDVDCDGAGSPRGPIVQLRLWELEDFEPQRERLQALSQFRLNSIGPGGLARSPEGI